LDTKIRILFLAADPSDLTRTRLASEYQAIKEEVKRGRHGSQFLLREEFSVQIEDMTWAVKDFRPHILHFSGHGSVDGELCFEDRMARARRVDLRNLDGIFAGLAGQVDCVVLNACYSAKQAARISKHIPCVIGLRSVITEQAADLFSRGFYQALSAGETIESAFKAACALLEAHGLLGSTRPVIKMAPGKLPSVVRGAPDGRPFSEQREPPATVTVRDARSGRDTRIEASPGSVDARQVVAGRDLEVKAKRSEQT
jgi:hypothetical protein